MTRVERLYHLLPAVLRLRDAANGEPLRALMAVLESEFTRLERETETTWDDWFIETCEEWLVPYIGDALGVKGMRSISATGFSQRAFVANTLAYRRRKGTAAVLEQLARDVTGHGSRVVEYFQRVALTPHVQHVRGAGVVPSSYGTLDIHDPLKLQDLGGPFNQEVHSAEVRHIDQRGAAIAPDGDGGGMWNLPHVGLHLWRLRSDLITRSEARAVANEPAWYHFDPHGRDLPLFNVARSETDITSLAGPEHVVRALSRLELSSEERGKLPARWLSPRAVVRVRIVADDASETLFTAAGDVGGEDALGNPALIDPQALVPVGAALLPRLRIAHLAELAPGVLPTRRPPDPRIVDVDPENGRLVFHPDAVATRPAAVLVDYAAGYASELGAGPWDRTQSLTRQLDAGGLTPNELTAQWGVSASTADGSQVFATLAEAVAAWNAHVAGSIDPANEAGLIAIMDNRLYSAGAPEVTIELPTGARLILVAASWPIELVDGLPQRQLGRFVPNRVRASIESTLVVEASSATGTTRAGGLWLNGLSIEGGVRVLPGALEQLSLAHCTLISPAGISVEGSGPTGNTALRMWATRCLMGNLESAGPIASVELEDCAAEALTFPEATLRLDASTLLGLVRCRVLWSSNSVFAQPLTVEHTQLGCVRFSFVPSGSHTPRRFRCQPDQALDGIAAPSQRRRIIGRLRPIWTTRDSAHPAYLQLAPHCPQEISRGGEDGREMGVFFHLEHPWREDNLRAALRQYLRHGLEAGLRYES